MLLFVNFNFVVRSDLLKRLKRKPPRFYAPSRAEVKETLAATIVTRIPKNCVMRCMSRATKFILSARLCYN
jgi:hypothetical protein